MIAYYATLSLGAQVVMTNPLYTPRELEHQWTDAGCRVAVVMDVLYANRIRAVRDRLPIDHYVVTSIPDYMRFPLKVLARWRLGRADPRDAGGARAGGPLLHQARSGDEA